MACSFMIFILILFLFLHILSKNWGDVITIDYGMFENTQESLDNSRKYENGHNFGLKDANNFTFCHMLDIHTPNIACKIDDNL